MFGYLSRVCSVRLNEDLPIARNALLIGAINDTVPHLVETKIE